MVGKCAIRGEHGASGRSSGRRAPLCWLSLAPLLLGSLAGCDGFGAGSGIRPPRAVDAAALVHTSTLRDADPGQPFTVTAQPGATLTDVTLTSPDGRLVAGALDQDGHGWHSTARLVPGTHYAARIAVSDGHGGRGEETADVSTKAADRLLTATLGPDPARAVYGVGEPLTVQLSEAVDDPKARAEVEGDLSVVSDPPVTGAWHWVDGKNLHFRPQEYWPANTTVKLGYDAQGHAIDGHGLYGGAPVSVSFRTGDRVEAIVDAAAHQLTFKRNGTVTATIPVTTGRPGFDTRNGVKVVLSKEREVEMKSETIGIAKDSSDSFDLKVEWATRVTWSGEYVHAAPWSVSSQGVENVSHGCTGMTTAYAKWFFEQTRVGDIVQVINSRGHQMEPFGNGFGDWNVAWDAWLRGSALGRTVDTTAPAPEPQAAATLHPQS
ncbi:Ig-like domain-containing protein [Kitasatospora sp. NPDC052896]|uniref:L,D-transpeptidase n=1 Tax=Kitasatospora sp. NPDC052896 TaxID=3364061 RepID=UPI0037CC64FF